MTLSGSRRHRTMIPASALGAPLALVIAGAVLVGLPSGSRAQTGSPSMLEGGVMAGNHSGRRMGVEEPAVKPPAPSLPVKAVKEPWPRLERGAVLCRSRDDLVRLQAGPGATPAPDCHILRERTAIKVLERDGPARTHIVATDDSKQTGWTNVYLTNDPPPSATTPDARPTVLPGEPGSSTGKRPGGGPGRGG